MADRNPVGHTIDNLFTATNGEENNVPSWMLVYILGSVAT